MRFEFERIGVQHHLAAASAERLRDGSSGNAGQLIANDVLRDVFQLGLGEAFASESEQADGQAGGVELQNHGRQRAGRQPAHLRRRKAAHHGDGRIRVRSRMEDRP